ncbi:hypothetical protein DFP72DRAFT_604329 [Ephemerocybe angulata]|uniref:Carrier domain-containing protein n=1 Tax=Ephemerocybe angulata TaxID=980116 RepID=A0A8H6HIR5_9AGAR|nr:hypothetical protein DFP72DRAFT_604329 [Tulosesus angulatus]
MRSFAPKVLGAWNLHVLTQKMALIAGLLRRPQQYKRSRWEPLVKSLTLPRTRSSTYLASLRHSLGLPGTSLQLGAWESRLTENLNMKKSFALMMSQKEGVPLILQAMSTSHPVQVIAEFDVPKLQSVPAYANDPFFAAILPKSFDVRPAPTPASAPSALSSSKVETVKKDARTTVVDILRSVMELRPSESLDLASSLTACGGDSITFAQLKGRILKEVGVDLPSTFLGETYTLGDIVDFAMKGA